MNNDKFEAMVDMIADAPINRPCPVWKAAAAIGISPIVARALWTALCDRFGEEYSTGGDYREIVS